MQFFKRWLQQTLGFTQAQSTGFLILFPLIILVIFSNSIYRAFQTPFHLNTQAQQHLLDSMVLAWEKQSTAPASKTLTEANLFAFNPNTVSKEELITLGISSTVASRLIHYRNKGGKFKTRSDFMKVYGIDSVTYSRLSTYILLPNEAEQKPVPQAFTKTKHSARLSSNFDINLADTTQLKSVNGIGSKLAGRIIKYRSALGGFVSQRQFYEVWGLDSGVVDRLTLSVFISENFTPTYLFINQATEKELATHPYLSKTIARAIVAYRFQHGNFNSLADLEKVQPIDPKTIKKIAPYLNFQ